MRNNLYYTKQQLHLEALIYLSLLKLSYYYFGQYQELNRREHVDTSTPKNNTIEIASNQDDFDDEDFFDDDDDFDEDDFYDEGDFDDEDFFDDDDDFDEDGLDEDDFYNEGDFDEEDFFDDDDDFDE